MSEERKSHVKPIVIISTDNKGNRFFPSVKAASLETRIPRYRLFEALDSKSGLIKGSDPPLYIDLASELCDVEKDIDEDEEDD